MCRVNDIFREGPAGLPSKGGVYPVCGKNLSVEKVQSSKYSSSVTNKAREI